MKQTSTSVPDYAYEVLCYLTEVTGKSQSAIIAPYVERGIFEELGKIEQHLESMKSSGIDIDENDMNATNTNKK